MKHTKGATIQENISSTDNAERLLPHSSENNRQHKILLLIISAAIGTVVLSAVAISGIVRAGILQRFNNSDYTEQAAGSAMTAASESYSPFLANYLCFRNTMPQNDGQ